jgi:hypothetical protein
MNTRAHIIVWATTLLIATSSQSYSQGSLIFQHLGASDPVNEGASLVGTGTTGPVLGDFGFDSWSISGGAVFYRRNLTPEQLATIAVNDWTISLNLRIVTNASFVSLRTGTGGFTLQLYSQSDGDPVVSTFQGLSYIFEGGGSGYHDYAFKYSVSLGKAALWIDGVERLSGIGGSSSIAGATFDWGIVQVPAAATANWNLVSLSVVPEPSSAGLSICAGLLFIAHAIRRRRV